MRIRTETGRAGMLGYCANVHPGEALADVLRAIRVFGNGVREQLSAPALSLGLWFSRAALSELETEPSKRDELARALEEARVFVVTLNGFPYGNFHAPVVKRRVYHPDLSTPERRAYLLGLARVLSGLVPQDAAEGTISTLPIGHRDEPSGAAATSGSECIVSAAEQLCTLAEELAQLADRSGKPIRICLEPEPGCVLESTADALAFFSDTLPRVAKRLGTQRAKLEQHLGVCYDTCHQAVCFEQAEASIRALAAAGVRIGKAQLSSALELTRPSDLEARAELLGFAEPRYLHQVRARAANGELTGVDDLDRAADLPGDRPWRVHFHVPIHRPSFGRLATTRPFLEAALPALAALDPLPHLEVETYTWSVLPEHERPSTDTALVRGLASEVQFAREVLS